MSRVNLGAKAVMYPMLLLLTAAYDKNGVPDAMNAAYRTWQQGRICI